MDTPKPGFVDFYYQGRIFEVEEQDPQGTAERLSTLLSDYRQAGDDDAMLRIQTHYHIREVGVEAEAGTDDLQNPLWLKLDTSRRLVGTTGTEVDPRVAELIHSAGIVGDGRRGDPIAFCVPNPRTGRREIWRIAPQEIAVSSRRQIEEMLVEQVTQALEAGLLS